MESVRNVIKKMKLNEKHLKEFKKLCEYYKLLYQLNGWQIYYGWTNEENCKATASVNLQGRTITIKLSKEFEDFSKEELRITAKHEILHVLIGRLGALATSRHVTADEIYEASEELVISLTNLLDD